ncbi:hypothetical protein [Priestia sp. FSL R5-0680]|uniref:hypothetical protein n=1 Tax=Priestia sp. FSL R5-0680 TaxID=2921582 RepID=UPI0030F95733
MHNEVILGAYCSWYHFFTQGRNISFQSNFIYQKAGIEPAMLLKQHQKKLKINDGCH